MFWVRDLIDEANQKWNIPKLKRTFIPYDIEKIIQIPIENQEEEEEDILMWMDDKTIYLGQSIIGFKIRRKIMKLITLSIWSIGLCGGSFRALTTSLK